METLITIVYVLVSVFLILVVLLQSGKGAGMGAAFGGGGQTMFGGRGPTTFLHKMTAGCAILFMILSVVLASLSGGDFEVGEDQDDPPKQEAGMGPVNSISQEDKPAVQEEVQKASSEKEPLPEVEKPAEGKPADLPTATDEKPKESAASTTDKTPAQDKTPDTEKPVP
jgi:preprotein translocase subunit SecG